MKIRLRKGLRPTPIKTFIRFWKARGYTLKQSRTRAKRDHAAEYRQAVRLQRTENREYKRYKKRHQRQVKGN